MNLKNEKVRTAVRNLLILSFSVLIWVLPIPSERHPNERWLINDAANRVSAILSELGGNAARKSKHLVANAVNAQVFLCTEDNHHQVLTYCEDNITAICLVELALLIVIGLPFVRRKRHFKKLAYGVMAWVTTFGAIFIARALVFGVMIVRFESVAIIQPYDIPLRLVLLAMPALAFKWIFDLKEES